MLWKRKPVKRFPAWCINLFITQRAVACRAFFGLKYHLIQLLEKEHLVEYFLLDILNYLLLKREQLVKHFLSSILTYGVIQDGTTGNAFFDLMYRSNDCFNSRDLFNVKYWLIVSLEGEQLIELFLLEISACCFTQEGAAIKEVVSLIYCIVYFSRVSSW